ncbi:hypothetical protein SynPROSU1_01355 [Synechococcus sp. PROS-U-1]|nr:hypothetical protein SynPROSU1_01355 [Synechococcus sp. PROS-U-1]
MAAASASSSATFSALLSFLKRSLAASNHWLSGSIPLRSSSQNLSRRFSLSADDDRTRRQGSLWSLLVGAEDRTALKLRG